MAVDLNLLKFSEKNKLFCTMSTSSRASKRKLGAKDNVESEVMPEKRERLSSDDGSGLASVSRTGRVRKKSSKIREMEEGFDDLQEVLTGRKKKKADAERQAKAADLRKDSEFPADIGDDMPQETEDDKGAMQGLLTTPPQPVLERSSRSKRKKADVKTPPAVKMDPDGSLKMTLQIPSPMVDQSPEKAQLILKKEPMSPLPPLDIGGHQDVTVMEGESALKLKLILSPTRDRTSTSFSSPEGDLGLSGKKKSKGETKKKKEKKGQGSGIEAIKIKDILAAQQKARDAQAAEQEQLVQQSALAMHLTQASPGTTTIPVIQASITSNGTTFVPVGSGRVKKKKNKKKSKEKKSDEIDVDFVSGVGEEGGLKIDLVPKVSTVKKKKKKDGKASGKKTPKKKEATKYANTDAMAMKLKTWHEKKKASTKSKKKKGLLGLTDKPKKRRRGPTAYMLWCSTYRFKVIAENPTRDFAQISKRLGEIWQGLPEKEKLSWKRKAKKIANKGSTLITTGKIKAAKNSLPKLNSKITSTGPAASTTAAKASAAGLKKYEVSTTSPVDVAAHLKLLGESLSIIGNRLTESRGQIAVQGSLSVMLDSLLCALGPLTCLTSQVPETKVIPDKTLAGTLDNIAYFMPGL